MNIRQKVLLGIIVAIFSFVILGGISYNHLMRIEEMLKLAEIVDDLNSDILEIRRYEKNFLLYNKQEDYRESLLYVNRGLELVDRILDAHQREEVLAEEGLVIWELRKKLSDYRDAFEAVASEPPAVREAGTSTGLVPLRERGKMLVAASRGIVDNQRHGILYIVNTLKRQLLFAILAFLATGTLFGWLVGSRIIAALQIIENATGQIAKGRFTTLPVPSGHDETRKVVKALNRMAVELERRQNQLLQEKKLASLGVLTSGIAHQLNNPLNNISTSCQILREEDIGQNDPFVARMLDNIHQEVIRGRDIVKGLLEFSRENDFSLTLTRLSDIVDRSVGLVASDLPPDVDITREVPDDLAAPMDGQRMQEVLINLLLNAAQAIGPAPGTIAIAARRDEEAGQAVISVSDTGRGIPPEHLGRVFDPFFTLKEVGKGTGLGLSVVFGIIKKHGGTIVAESEPGQGATFIIRLPLARPGQEATSA